MLHPDAFRSPQLRIKYLCSLVHRSQHFSTHRTHVYATQLVNFITKVSIIRYLHLMAFIAAFDLMKGLSRWEKYLHCVHFTILITSNVNLAIMNHWTKPTWWEKNCTVQALIECRVVGGAFVHLRFYRHISNKVPSTNLSNSFFFFFYFNGIFNAFPVTYGRNQYWRKKWFEMLHKTKPHKLY